MKKIILVMFGIFMACSSNQIYSDSDYKNGKVLKMSAGEIVEFKLDSQPSTGYSWQPSFPQEKFVLVSNSIIPQKKSVPETGQIEIQLIKIKALIAGESEIEFNYIKQWENEKPSQTMKVKVDVIKGL